MTRRIRPATPAEQTQWVRSSWLSSWRGALRHPLPSHAVAMVDAILAATTARICELETPAGPLAAGWLVADGAQVHYLYVRHLQRSVCPSTPGQPPGIARLLLGTMPAVLRATILTEQGRTLAHRVLGRVPRLDPWPRLGSVHAAA